MSIVLSAWRAIGRILPRRRPGVPRKVLDAEGNVICVAVGRPLTAEQQRQVDNSNHRPSDAPAGTRVPVPSWLE